MKPKSKILVRREGDATVHEIWIHWDEIYRYFDVYSTTIFIYAEEGCVSANWIVPF